MSRRASSPSLPGSFPRSSVAGEASGASSDSSSEKGTAFEDALSSLSLSRASHFEEYHQACPADDTPEGPEGASVEGDIAGELALEDFPSDSALANARSENIPDVPTPGSGSEGAATFGKGVLGTAREAAFVSGASPLGGLIGAETSTTTDESPATQDDGCGNGFITTHFRDPSDLTRALDDAMHLVLMSDIMSLLSPFKRGEIRAEAERNTYRAAHLLSLVVSEPHRTDIQHRVLAFVQRIGWLHQYLRTPPQRSEIRDDLQDDRPRLQANPAPVQLREFLKTELDPVEEKPHKDHLQGCLPNTRVQVLEDLHTAVRRAIEQRGRQLVWLKGLVGAGKTSVMSTAANQLACSLRVARYYCAREATRSDPRRVLPTLACILGLADADVGRVLKRNILDKPQKATAPVDQLECLVVDPLRRATASATVIFVDALDECTRGDALDQLLEALASESQDDIGSVVFVVSSRPEPALERLRTSASTIDLDAPQYTDVTQQDVELYVRHHLPNFTVTPLLEKIQHHPPYDAAIAQIVNITNGYFVTASFICTTVRTGVGRHLFLEKMLSKRKFVSHTETLYAQCRLAIVTAFDEASWREKEMVMAARKILAVLCCAQALLSLVCIEKLGGIDANLIGDVLAALAPLLLCSSNQYAFFHASVADFLESKDAGGYRVSAYEYHGELFSSCRDILRSQLEFNVFGISNSNISLDQLDLEAVSPELVYASTFWTHHLAASSLSREVAGSAVTALLESKLLFWLEVLSGLRRVNSAGIGGLNRVSTFLNASVGDFVTDCLRCLYRWRSDISSHPCRIYLTAIPWVPPFFREALQNRGFSALSVSPRVLLGGPSQWSNEIRTWNLGSGVHSVAWSLDGHLVAAGKGDGTVELRDVRTGERYGSALRGHTSAVYSVAFSSDGLMVASGSKDGTVRLWDTESGAPRGEPLRGHTDLVRSVAFSPDGSMIASGSDDTTVRLWDTESGAPRGEPLRGYTSWVLSVAFSPDGSMVASGSFDTTVRLWDTESGAPRGEPLQGHINWVGSVAFSPDGSMIASGSIDGTVRLWDTESGAPRGEPLQGHTSTVTSVAFSPDSSMIASGSRDETVRLWDTESGAPRGEPLQGHTDWVWSVAFSPDGSMIASGSDDETVRLWDTASGAPRGEPLQGHTSLVRSVAFSPDSSMIASGSRDETVRLWDTEPGAPRGEPLRGHTSGVNSVVFSKDGTKLTSLTRDEMFTWDLITGARLLDRVKPSAVDLSSYSTPKSTFALLPQGYKMMAYSPTSRTLAGRFGSRGNEVFAMSLPSEDPWKSLCDTHAQSRRARTNQRRSACIAN